MHCVFDQVNSSCVLAPRYQSDLLPDSRRTRLSTYRSLLPTSSGHGDNMYSYRKAKAESGKFLCLAYFGGGVRGKRIQSSASQTINICGNHCGFVNLQILIYWVRAGTQDFVHLTSCHRVARIRFLCFILLFPNNIFSNYVNNNMLHI